MTRDRNDTLHAYRAGVILTMEPDRDLIEDGLLLSRNGVIQDIGPYGSLKRHIHGEAQDLGPGTMVPGLINAHLHLELSHLAGKTVLHEGFEPWVRSMITPALKRFVPDVVAHGLHQVRESRTVCVGDISGHNPARMLEMLQGSGLEHRLFVEFLGFKPPKSDQVKWPKGISPSRQPEVSAAGHSLYSTHPCSLQLVKSWSSRSRRPFTMHLAEHQGEVELLTTGRGSFADLARTYLLPRDFVPPGISPVAYADSLALLDRGTLAVHCVHVGRNDIRILKERNVSVCICPRSNARIGVGRAPWEKLHEAGIPLCLTTDGLCSNKDLNLWNEAEYLLQHWNGPLSLRELIGFLTRNPARALGVDAQLGTLRPGKSSAFAVIPEGIGRALPV
jgi:cytosine/adenosine deaminase-related metal-dependent hydrolase